MYGVHTLILNQQLSLQQADKLNKDMGTGSFYSIVENLKEKASYVFNLRAIQLTRKSDIVVTKQGGRFYVYFRLQLAPNDILTGTTTEDVFESSKENIELFMAKLDLIFSESFKDYEFIEKDCTKWLVSYIEYAANLYSNNIELAMELLRKNAKDTNFKEFKDDTNAICTINRKSKYKRSRSTTLYDKEKAEHSKHQERLQTTGDEVKCIRFELQCGRSSLWLSIAKKQRENDNLMYYLNEAIIIRVLASGYASKFATGDFYSLEYIRKYIKDKKLVEYAESATKSRSIKCTKVKAKSGKSTISVATNNKRIRAFDKLGIAPVAIPVRANTDVLFNPMPHEWLQDGVYGKKIYNFFTYKGISFDTSTNTITHIKGA